MCICIHEHFLIGQFNCQYCISRLHLTPQCRYKVSRCKSYIMTNSFSEFSAFQVQINPDAKCMLAHVINTNKVIIVRMPLRNPTRYLGVSGSWGSTKNSKSGKGMKRSHPRPRHPRHPRPSKKQQKWHVQKSNQLRMLSPWIQSKDPSKPASALLL